MINKLLGFYELQKLNIPTIKWQKFNDDTILDEDILWTVRTAVYEGDDLNLPRAVGVSSKEAYDFYHRNKKLFNSNGLIIYYPYFIAIKSGTLQISENSIVIEAVDGDLWNLVTKNKKDVTVRVVLDNISYDGNDKFLKEYELNSLLEYANIIKKREYRNILAGDFYLLEWSYAINTNINNDPIGEQYILFYEYRNI